MRIALNFIEKSLPTFPPEIIMNCTGIYYHASQAPGVKGLTSTLFQHLDTKHFGIADNYLQIIQSELQKLP